MKSLENFREKIKEKLKTPIPSSKKNKTIFIIFSIVVFLFIVGFAINHFYVKKTICESYPYLSVLHNDSAFENGSIPLDKFYSNFTIPKGQSFCIGEIKNRSITDKVYNKTYDDAYCDGKMLSSGKTYKVYCSNEKNRSVTSCSVLLNCSEIRKWVMN